MSIRWIRNVLVDGRRTTLEVFLGFEKISDRCYVRVGTEEEFWFTPHEDSREGILREGLDMLRRRLEGRSVQGPPGLPFQWN